VGTILGIIGSLVIGGAVATATVIGVVNAQTGTTGNSPADATQQVFVDYGSN
jgi:hypothetical protein